MTHALAAADRRTALGGPAVRAEVAAAGNRGPGKTYARNTRCGRGLRGDNGSRCAHKGPNRGRSGDTGDPTGQCGGRRACCRETRGRQGRASPGFVVVPNRRGPSSLPFG